MRAIVFGGDGSIGSAVYCELVRREIYAIRTTIDKKTASDENWLYFDLADPESDWILPDDINVAFLFSAITSMQTCEQYPVKTRMINVEKTCKLIKRLHERGIFVIYPSSNQVFNGIEPFVCSGQKTSPVTEYGRHKAEVEAYLQKTESQSAIVRLTKVITPTTPVFCQWISNLIQNQPIYPFHDMVFAPIPLSLVVEVMILAAERRFTGILQVSGNRDIAYTQAAAYIAESIGADSGLIQPISIAEKGINDLFVPLHTTMDMSRLNDSCNISPPCYTSVLDEFILRRSCV